jgi:uncharacterized protein (TIGR03435 family)
MKLLQGLRTVRLAVSVLLPLFCSNSEAQSPSFEVASIRVDRSGVNSSNWHDQKSRMTATNVSLRRLIAFAYQVHDFQVAGPDWLRSDRFDIQAEAPEWAEKDKRPIIMRNLLVERFNLVVHVASKQLPTYALTLAKQGPKLQSVDQGGASGVTSTRGSLILQRASMQEIVDSLSRIVDRPVIDKTGLAGGFNGGLHWTPVDQDADSAAAGSAPDNGPSLFTAIQEQFGLKLVPQKALIRMLVIDRVEKIPTENEGRDASAT